MIREYDKKGNMIINTDYKLFDKQTNLITTGNVIANTQYSSYIRPFKEIKNGNHIGKPGDFVKYDMKFFNKIPLEIKNYLLDEKREESCILYQIFVTKKDDNRSYYKDIIGYILTDNNYKLITSSAIIPYKCNSAKRFNVLDECIKYVCK